MVQCWRRLVGVFWGENRTNKSVPEELVLVWYSLTSHSTQYSVISETGELVLEREKVKLQYFGHVPRGSAGEIVLEGSTERWFMV